MSFNTIPFLLFLALAAALYYIVGPRAKQAVLLAASLAFYLFGTTPGFVVFLLLTAAVTYGCARRLEAAPGRRGALWCALAVQLGLLCFFKYNRFFPQLAEALGESGFPYAVQTGGLWRLMLPLGISYYTFQSLGYVIDVSAGRCRAEKNFFDYLLFICFFPQITAGPIGRAGELLPQLKAPRTFDGTAFCDGLRLMLIGFFKKIAVADMLAMFVNPIFSAHGDYSGLTLTAASVLYAFQLYCDFSGYSDIARGCAALFGIRLRENFDTPYLSASFGELWKRWHMSLSAWLRDYVYIGMLGGSRRGKARKYLNLFLTFVISGLWHGVGLTFLVWGALQGLFQMAENFLRSRGRLSADPGRFWFAVRVLVVFSLNTATLTLFRADTLRDGFAVLAGQFSGLSLSGFVSQAAAAIGQGFNATPILMAGYAVFCALGLAAVIRADFLRRFTLSGGCLAEHLGRQSTAVRWLCYYGMLAFILAAFIMQNGNYVGRVSFAYGGF